MKIINEQTDVVQLQKMKDGQIGVIVSWDDCPHYIGRIVQRVGESLIELGEGLDRSWRDPFTSNRLTSMNYIIRILPKGTILEL